MLATCRPRAAHSCRMPSPYDTNLIRVATRGVVTLAAMSITETISQHYRGLDAWDDAAILAAFADGQRRAVAAVERACGAIATAARAIVARLGEDGRLIYVGAGTSGLLAALDGMELAGTFDWPEERTVFVLASGTELKPGMTGGSEDDGALARAEIARLTLQPADVVIAVAASGSTPFTLGAVEAAREARALTVGLANNPDAALLKLVDQPILLDSGAEVIRGSTRMGAGTAQKAALGLLSSLIMIRLGRVHDGHMVDLRVDNAKLRKRAVTMLVDIAHVDEHKAAHALDACHGHIKQAALVAKGLAPEDATRVLAETHGNLRAAMARFG
jgi:N-acetylmuramic acid 6-phosphate etherase